MRLSLGGQPLHEVKTQLQHVLIAISMNLVRLVAWFANPTHSPTQTSRFVALAPAV